jgi:hypothetical protein
MPEICRFLGIVITMYFDEHNPPHFHVRYNEYRASIEIQTLNVVAGAIPAKVRGLVEESESCTNRSFWKCGNRRISTN